MKRLMTQLKAGVLCGLMSVTTPLWAEEATTDVAQQIVDRLKQARPDLEFSQVQPAPVAGLYEVRVQGGPTLYVTEDGKFFIAGDLFSVQDGKFVNIQEQARAEERVKMLADIDKAEQIVFAPEGETKAVVHVFTDVDCGYCQKLHREMDAINAKGIEVRYLAYPRSGPGTQSAQKLATAWCAKDPQKTLTQLKQRKQVPISVCEDHPVAEHYRLGGLMGVNGTPNMVTESGEMIGGYVPADRLAKILGISDE